MNRKGVAERFAALGFGCDGWTDPPGQVWADFVQDVDEIVMLIDGEMEISFAGKTLRPGRRGDRDPGGREPHRQRPIDKMATNRCITDGGYAVRDPQAVAAGPGV
jgi:hypothetical protein